jgi:hypothetical protein
MLLEEKMRWHEQKVEYQQTSIIFRFLLCYASVSLILIHEKFETCFALLMLVQLSSKVDYKLT